MDLVLKNARLASAAATTVDIGVDRGRIVAIESALAADAEVLDLQGRLVMPGLVETHIHLDKSGIVALPFGHYRQCGT